MENLLAKDPDINVVYTINEPAAAGAYEALKAVGKEGASLIVSVDGGCPGVRNVEEGVIGATSQQYPLLMASLGIEAIANFANDGTKPTPTEGKDFFDTGVTLVTDQPVDRRRVDRHQEGPDSAGVDASRSKLVSEESGPMTICSQGRPSRRPRCKTAPYRPPDQGRTTMAAEFDRVRTGFRGWHQAAPTETVAEFDDHEDRVLQRSSTSCTRRHRLVPLIVLIVAVIVFGLLIGEVLLGLALTTHPAAGRHRRHRRLRADAGHPDRRHRSCRSARSWCSARSSWASSRFRYGMPAPAAIAVGSGRRHG